MGLTAFSCQSRPSAHVDPEQSCASLPSMPTPTSIVSEAHAYLRVATWAHSSLVSAHHHAACHTILLLLEEHGALALHHDVATFGIGQYAGTPEARSGVTIVVAQHVASARGRLSRISTVATEA